MRNRLFAGALALCLMLASAFGSLPALATQATLVTPSSPLSMTGLAAFLNSAFLSIGSCNSGTSAPANGTSGAAFAGECWINTTANPWVFSYTPDGTHWVEFGTLNTSTYVWTPYSSGQAFAPGVSVVNPGTGGLEGLLPVQTVTGTSKTDYATTGLFKKTRRSNSGSAMSDTFPVSSATGLVNGTRIVIANVDATATLTITAGSGTTMASGGSTDTVGPGRDVAYEYDSTATQWRRAYNTGTALLGPNNLSDVASAATAFANIVQPSGASALGGVKSLTCATSNWFSTLSTSGVFGCAQPNFTDLAGSLAIGQVPANLLTYAKIQQVTASRLLGNPTGSTANVSEISVGSTLAFSGTALQTAAMTGDVTASANSFATTIAANAVTYAKFQQVTASRLLGNPTGAGANASEITLGATLAFSSTALQTAAMTGDVTASANSFATTIAANAVTYAKFQQVVASSLVGNPTGSTANAQGITLGATLAFSGTALQTAAMTGDVTSLANSFATTIAANAVTYAKFQQVAASSLVGNPTGSTANAQGITLGATLGFSGTALQTVAMTGDVSSSANSFATTIAANAVTNAKLATMAANSIKGNPTGSGANAQDVTAKTARSNSLLNIDALTTTGDANYTIQSTDRRVAHTALTAARTDTLPAASSLNAGQTLEVLDFYGVASASLTISLTAAGSDTVNGVTSVSGAIASQYGSIKLTSDGSSKWTYSPAASGGGGSGTVTSIVAGTGLTGGTITTSGTIAVDSTVVDLLASAQSITGTKTFNNSTIRVLGSGAGYTTWASANTGATNYTMITQAANQTLAALDVTGQTISGGFTVSQLNQSAGNITLDFSQRSFQSIVNTGAFTITAPSTTNSTSGGLSVINGPSAGAVSFSGFSVGSSIGDTFATTLRESASCTATSASPAVFTYTAHGLPNNWPVYLTGTTAPTGLSLNTVYYTTAVATNTFELSATPGGAALNSSSTGTSITCNASSVFYLNVESINGLPTYGWKALQ